MHFIFLLSLVCVVVLLTLPVWVRFPGLTLGAGLLLLGVGVGVMAGYNFVFPSWSEPESIQYFGALSCAFGGMSLIAPSALMLSLRRYKKRLDHARDEDAAGKTPDLPAI